MDVAVAGTRYVGLGNDAGLAEFGSTEVCVDTDTSRVGALQRGQTPIYEKGLEELPGCGSSSPRPRWSIYPTGSTPRTHPSLTR